jgi:cholinesterase
MDVPFNIFVFALGTLAAANNFTNQASNWTVGQIVRTSSGPVQGQRASNATEVSEYLGIPFAKPPIGNLRFAAPEKYSGNSSINGTQFVRYPLNTHSLFSLYIRVSRAHPSRQIHRHLV